MKKIKTQGSYLKHIYQSGAIHFNQTYSEGRLTTIWTDLQVKLQAILRNKSYLCVKTAVSVLKAHWVDAHF